MLCRGHFVLKCPQFVLQDRVGGHQQLDPGIGITNETLSYPSTFFLDHTRPRCMKCPTRSTCYLVSVTGARPLPVDYYHHSSPGTSVIVSP